MTQTLFVGDASREEFRTTRKHLESLAELREVSDVDAAMAVLQEGNFVADVIVVAQAFPGQFSLADIDRLQRAAPLARVLGLLGSWCEGEARTGRPAPGMARIYWHQFPAQASREFAHLHSGRGSTWALPLTAGDDERLLAAHESLSTSPDEVLHGLIAIWSRRFEMQDWLSAACRLRGYATVWLAPDRTTKIRGVEAAIFDGCRCDKTEIAELAKFQTLLHNDSPLKVPVVALLDFPRIEDRGRALAAGAAEVIAKPFAVDDLFWHIDRLRNCESNVPL